MKINLSFFYLKKTVVLVGLLLIIVTASSTKADEKNQNVKNPKPTFDKIGVAILPIEDYVAKIEANIINLTSKLQNHQLFNLLDREFIEKVKIENQILHSSELNSDEAFLLGKLLQADIIVLIASMEGNKEMYSVKAIHSKLGIILFKKLYKMTELENMVADLETQIPIIKVKEKLEESKQFHLGLIGFGLTRENQKMFEIKQHLEEGLTNSLNKLDHFFLKELVNLNNIREESLLIKNVYKSTKLDNFIYGNIIILDEKIILELRSFDKDLQIISKDFPINLQLMGSTIEEIVAYINTIMATDRKDLFANSDKQADKIFELGSMYEKKSNTSLAIDFYQATFHIKPTHLGAVYQYILLLDKKIEKALINYIDEAMEPLQIAYELEIIKLQYFIILMKKKARYPALNYKINKKLSIDYYLKCPQKLRDKYDQTRLQLIDSGEVEINFYKSFIFNDTNFMLKALPNIVKSSNKLSFGARCFLLQDILQALYPKYDYKLKSVYENLEIKNEPIFNATLYSHLISRDFRHKFIIKPEQVIKYNDLFFKNFDELASQSKVAFLNKSTNDTVHTGLHHLLLELLYSQVKESSINFKTHFQNLLIKHEYLKNAFGNISSSVYSKEIYYFYSLESNKNDLSFKIDKVKLIEKINAQLLVAVETCQNNNDFCMSITGGIIGSLLPESIQEELGEELIQSFFEELQGKVITPSLKNRPAYWTNTAVFLTETAKKVCRNEFALKIKELNIKLLLECFENNNQSDELPKAIEKLKKL